MSHPLTRRIARTALLTAAGAATVIGAAGAASAVELPSSPLGGVSNLDGESLGNTVDKAARGTTGMAGKAGGNAVAKTLPAAGKAVGNTGKTVIPAAQNLAGNTAGQAGGLVGDTATSATGKGLPSTGNLGGLPIR
ncbi:ATP-binding protein [Streptomyces albus]|uniref:ATP-binding protein n=1 Tax=Streptomyces albus TaxID=1888 RepID=UPI0024AE78EF|nr:ATP-binding protein [Streptomyces albus]MDI6409092.1 ATP-binding protein [Streptomyces albus]